MSSSFVILNPSESSIIFLSTDLYHDQFYGIVANKIRRRRKVSDKWHLDEVRIKINGEVYLLWRAVDSEGKVLDILIQKRRNTKAAKQLMKKLLKKQGFAPNFPLYF